MKKLIVLQSIFILSIFTFCTFGNNSNASVVNNYQNNSGNFESISPGATGKVPYKSPVSVVYTHEKLTNIYNSKGDVYKSIHLAPNSAWYTDRIFTQNPGNDSLFEQYYRVSTDGYVRSSDVDIVNPDGSSVLKISGNNGFAYPLSYYYNDNPNESVNVNLAEDSTWKIGKVISFNDQYSFSTSHVWEVKNYLLQISTDSYVELSQNAFVVTIK